MSARYIRFLIYLLELSAFIVTSFGLPSNRSVVRFVRLRRIVTTSSSSLARLILHITTSKYA